MDGRKVDCREVREYLPAYLEQPQDLVSGQVSRHLKGCADCRVRAGQFRDLCVLLSELSGTVIEPPSALLATLLKKVPRAARRAQLHRLTKPALGAGGALLAAGVAGALFARGRNRRTSVHRPRRVLARA